MIIKPGNFHSLGILSLGVIYMQQFQIVKRQIADIGEQKCKNI